MKLLASLLFAAISYGLAQWLPSVFCWVAQGGIALAPIAAIATLLTSGWATNLSRLTALEKLDDLSGDQRQRVQSTARGFRRLIQRNIAFNVVAVVGVTVALSAAAKPDFAGAWVGYWVLSTLGFWLGGFIESLKCFNAIESTRETVVEAQAERKQRAAYLKKLREDAIAKPIDHNDAQLRRYSESCKSA